MRRSGRVVLPRKRQMGTAEAHPELLESPSCLPETPQ